jgi:oxygen-dependent protoporphyrinogen oxidase
MTQRRILVVDDEDNLRTMLVAALKFEGYQVAQAPDGRAGLRAAKELRPDLIVLDVMMPELDGFGMLIPSQEKKQTLGALFSSTLFPNRTPEGHVLFTCFIGGRRNPMAVENSDQQLVNLVSEELREMLDIQARPVFTKVSRWANAIPQYDVGHLTRIAKIDDIAERYKGLHLMGNWRDGISVGDCIDSGFAMAHRLITAER